MVDFVNPEEGRRLQAEIHSTLETIMNAINRGEPQALPANVQETPNRLGVTFDSQQARQADNSIPYDLSASGVGNYLSIEDPSEENSYYVFPYPGSKVTQSSSDVLNSSYDVEGIEGTISRQGLIFGKDLAIATPAKFKQEDGVYKLVEKGQVKTPALMQSQEESVVPGTLSEEEQAALSSLEQRFSASENVQGETTDPIDPIWAGLKGGQIPEGAILVSETPDSIARRRADASIKDVDLQTQSNNSYLAVPSGKGEYLLYPKPDLKVNSMSYGTFDALYEKTAGNPAEDPYINISQPARVKFDASKNQFSLVERGKASFSATEQVRTENKPKQSVKPQESVKAVKPEPPIEPPIKANPLAEKRAAAIREGQAKVEQSKSITDAVLARIKSRLKPEQSGEQIRVVVSGRNVLKANGSEITTPLLSERQQSILDRLLKGDKNIEGNIKAFIGKSEVLSIKDGVAQKDELNLFPDIPRKAETQSQTQSQHQEKSLVPSLESQIKALSEQLAQQSVKLEAIEQRLQQLEKPKEFSKNPKISELFGAIRGAAIERLKGAYENLSEKAKERAAKDIEAVKTSVTQTVQKVQDKVEETKVDMVALAANWLTNKVNPAVNTMLEEIGDRHEDGTLTFASRDYTYLKGTDGVITIARKEDGTRLTPENITGKDQAVMNHLREKVQTKLVQGSSNIQQGPKNI